MASKTWLDKFKNLARRRSACEGKKQYESFNAADSELRYLRRKLDNRDRMHVYHCKYCNHFHVGTDLK
jgi:hypothetical protein